MPDDAAKKPWRGLGESRLFFVCLCEYIHMFEDFPGVTNTRLPFVVGVGGLFIWYSWAHPSHLYTT